MTEGSEEETQEPRRPRVVDKRVSARDTSETPTEPKAEKRDPTPSQPDPGPEPQGAETAPAEPPAGDNVWTPEQEAEAQRMLQAMSSTPALDWVLNSCVTLANVAGVKLDGGDLEQARLAIDALAALVDGLKDRLGEAEAPLRRSLSQLQLAYAQVAAKP